MCARMNRSCFQCIGSAICQPVISSIVWFLAHSVPCRHHGKPNQCQLYWAGSWRSMCWTEEAAHHLASHSHCNPAYWSCMLALHGAASFLASSNAVSDLARDDSSSRTGSRNSTARGTPCTPQCKQKGATMQKLSVVCVCTAAAAESAMISQADWLHAH